jgi:hypothetical protein
LASASRSDLPGMLASLSYRAASDESGVTFHRKPPRKTRQAAAPPADGPFAKLASLQLAR